MTDLTSLCVEIMEARKFDADLSLLCDRAVEYARVYIHAKKLKGCNGLGEMENLLDEFRKMLYKILRYCGKKKYIDDLAIYDIEVTEQEIEKLSTHLETSSER